MSPGEGISYLSRYYQKIPDQSDLGREGLWFQRKWSLVARKAYIVRPVGDWSHCVYSGKGSNKFSLFIQSRSLVCGMVSSSLEEILNAVNFTNQQARVNYDEERLECREAKHLAQGQSTS